MLDLWCGIKTIFEDTYKDLMVGDIVHARDFNK